MEILFQQSIKRLLFFQGCPLSNACQCYLMKLGWWHHMSMSISSTITRTAYKLYLTLVVPVTWCFFFHKIDKILIHFYIFSFQFFPLFNFNFRNLFHFRILFYFFNAFLPKLQKCSFFHTHKVANLQVYIPLVASFYSHYFLQDYQ